jgi:hypothetical protein
MLHLLLVASTAWAACMVLTALVTRLLPQLAGGD